MSNVASRVSQPVDARGNVIKRAMGLPIVVDDITLLSDSHYTDIFDLTEDVYKSRAFTGFAIRNLSSSSTIHIAMGANLTEAKRIVVGTQEFFVLDDLMFGPPVIDDSGQGAVLKIRAKLGTAQGTAPSGTIDYSGSGQPSDQDTFELDGVTYEFSNDESKSPGNDFIVAIGADADATWTNFVNKINAVAQRVRASINTGTDIVTITGLVGGSAGNAIGMVDGGTGASLSGATLSGAVGGVTPVFHIW